MAQPPWARLRGAKRIAAEFKACCAGVHSACEFELVDDNLFKWRFKLRSFDDDLPGGKQLNQDLAQLKRQHGMNHLLMEVAFPADYPAQPFSMRVVKPRCVMYTGHVTAGGSICNESLTLSGTDGSWRPDFCVEAILQVVIANMQDCEVVYVETPTGPGGLTGPLRIDLHSYMTMLEYSQAEADAAFARMQAYHGVHGWGDANARTSNNASVDGSRGSNGARSSTGNSSSDVAGSSSSGKGSSMGGNSGSGHGASSKRGNSSGTGKHNGGGNGNSGSSNNGKSSSRSGSNSGARAGSKGVGGSAAGGGSGKGNSDGISGSSSIGRSSCTVGSSGSGYDSTNARNARGISLAASHTATGSQHKTATPTTAAALTSSALSNSGFGTAPAAATAASAPAATPARTPASIAASNIGLVFWSAPAPSTPAAAPAFSTTGSGGFGADAALAATVPTGTPACGTPNNGGFHFWMAPIPPILAPAASFGVTNSNGLGMTAAPAAATPAAAPAFSSSGFVFGAAAPAGTTPAAAATRPAAVTTSSIAPAFGVPSNSGFGSGTATPAATTPAAVTSSAAAPCFGGVGVQAAPAAITPKPAATPAVSTPSSSGLWSNPFPTAASAAAVPSPSSSMQFVGMPSVIWMPRARGSCKPAASSASSSKTASSSSGTRDTTQPGTDRQPEVLKPPKAPAGSEVAGAHNGNVRKSDAHDDDDAHKAGASMPYGRFLVQPPKHWETMTPAEVKAGVKLVQLPLPGASAASTSGTCHNSSSSASISHVINQDDLDEMMYNGVPQQDAIAALQATLGNVVEAYAFHLASSKAKAGAAAGDGVAHSQRSKREQEEAEAAHVVGKFNETMADSGRVVRRIERVQNLRLLSKYEFKADELAELHGGPSHLNQEELWHGPKSFENLKAIVKRGFDHRVSSLHGALGAGTYFARDACYSDAYRSDGHRSSQYAWLGFSSGVSALAGHSAAGKYAMLLCKVTLGRIGVGMPSLRRPPDGFDSVSSTGCAKLEDGGIVAVFDNAQAYPLYVVYYD